MTVDRLRSRRDDRKGVPEGAPSCPAALGGVKAGEQVQRMADPEGPAGYTFSGWKSEETAVSDDGLFEMPASNVLFIGSCFIADTYGVVISKFVGNLKSFFNRIVTLVVISLSFLVFLKLIQIHSPSNLTPMVVAQSPPFPFLYSL